MVYVFGAGINRSIKNAENLRPPLMTDLFKQALRDEMLNYEGRAQLGELFAYVERYWKLTAEDLREKPFDLEACFTLLQQQRREAVADDNAARDEYIARVEDQFASLLTKYLDSFQDFPAMDLLELGKRVYESRAAVLTFNYDTILENMIEFAAGDNDAEPPRGERVSDEQLSYSNSNWNRALVYGVRFDEVELQQTAAVLEPVTGDRFYGHPDNALYDPPLLKLHGSLNWFVHTSRRTYPHPYGVTTNPKEGKTVLTSGYPWLKHGFGKPDRDGWVLEPIVVMPVLYKELVDKVLVSESWRRAREELSGCRRLVVGGYSFPPSDFAMSKLFLEAFVDGPPEELVSINPDRGVAGRAAELCHFGRTPLIRENLEEYLEHP
jgi:hypothetical protein